MFLGNLSFILQDFDTHMFYSWSELDFFNITNWKCSLNYDFNFNFYNFLFSLFFDLKIQKKRSFVGNFKALFN